jgi:gliding motility-associated-like protein
MQKIWLLHIILFNTILVSGQSIEPPLIESVSVNPLSGMVTVQWKASPTPGINGYIIYEYTKTGGVWGGKNGKCITDPNKTDTTFSYDTVSYRPTYFFIIAFKGTCDTFVRSTFVNVHRTIYTSLNYDSCKSQITINWTKYLGWGDSLASYKIFRIIGTTVVPVASNLANTDSTYVVSGINGNQNYCYYVEADHVNGTKVTSNLVCQQTYENLLPDYLNANRAVFLSNSLVQLDFTLDPASQTKNYQLTASDNHDGEFTPIKSFYNYSGDNLIYVDTLTRLAPKYYRLEALNSCNIGVKFSNLATAMVPLASIGTNEVSLIWNEYREWMKGVSEYIIYRSVGDAAYQQIHSLQGTSAQYTDNVSDLAGQQLSGNICYYVEAVQGTNVGTGGYRSRSATACVDISANIFIPNAFTPNGDGQNDEFKPSFAFLPSNYSLTIFNRSGFKIFETSDPLKGWDGRYGNNEKAAEGVYVYFIKFTTGSGKTVEKKGSFSVVYP